MDLQLEGKAVLVTGGSKGIGRATALLFAEEGADVVVTGRDAESLASVESELRTRGVRALAIGADVRNEADCTNAVEATARAFGRLDVLVNNAAGPAHHGFFFELSEEQLMARMHTKTLGAMRMSRLVVPHMRASGGGRIICIGGSSVRRPSPDSLAAGISNAALANFAKHLSDLVIADGILVNTVHPSTTRTGTWSQLLARRATQLGVSEAEAEASLAATFPLGRVPDAAEVAYAVVFLASAWAGAVTGQSIVVDGGKVRSVAY